MYIKYALCLIKDPDIVGLAMFIRIRNLFVLFLWSFLKNQYIGWKPVTRSFRSVSGITTPRTEYLLYYLFQLSVIVIVIVCVTSPVCVPYLVSEPIGIRVGRQIR